MPLGRRQYQLAVALPGMRMSYQDYTHAKGNLDECINAEDTLIPFGRFLAMESPGQMRLPSATYTNIVGFNCSDGNYYEMDTNEDLESGIPSNQYMGYYYKGVFASEMVGTIARGATVTIAADDTDAANKGKLAGADYTSNTIALPGNYVVTRIVDGLCIVEIDFPSTLRV